jgi:hypothetical protein
LEEVWVPEGEWVEGRSVAAWEGLGVGTKGARLKAAAATRKRTFSERI